MQDYHAGINARYPVSIWANVIDRLANEEALFVADDGTVGVWMLRHIRANGKRRMYASLLHGTMAGGYTTALGLQKCQPGRQVIAMAGDGGFSMLMGDLITTIQENIPIKICVFDNAKLGFVELEQKSEGLEPTFTDNENPDFGAVAKAVGLWGKTISDPEDVEAAVEEWLAQPRSCPAQCTRRAAGDRDATFHGCEAGLWHGHVFPQGDPARPRRRRLRDDRGEPALNVQPSGLRLWVGSLIHWPAQQLHARLDATEHRIEERLESIPDRSGASGAAVRAGRHGVGRRRRSAVIAGIFLSHRPLVRHCQAAGPSLGVLPAGDRIWQSGCHATPGTTKNTRRENSLTLQPVETEKPTSILPLIAFE